MSTRAKYTRVRGQDQNKQTKLDTDILMKLSDRYGKYVSRALTLFFGEDQKFVTIKAAERVIDRALWVAHVVTRKVQGLHQIVNISERKTVDVWEPREEGLSQVKEERFITIIEVTLTKDPSAADKKHPGYSAPIKGDDFLTKQTWEIGEKEREEKRQARKNNRGENRDNRDNRDNRGEKGGYRDNRGENRGYRDNRDNRDNRGERDNRGRRDREQRGGQRGGQRRRGRGDRRD